MRDSSPFRQYRTPEPCTVLNPFDPGHAAALILARIAAITHSRGGRCFLFVDECQWAYVIAEDRAAAQHWLEVRSEWWRGTFSARTALDDLLAELT